jgi:hypothetical protein
MYWLKVSLDPSHDLRLLYNFQRSVIDALRYITYEERNISLQVIVVRSGEWRKWNQMGKGKWNNSLLSNIALDVIVVRSGEWRKWNQMWKGKWNNSLSTPPQRNGGSEGTMKYC